MGDYLDSKTFWVTVPPITVTGADFWENMSSTTTYTVCSPKDIVLPTFDDSTGKEGHVPQGWAKADTEPRLNPGQKVVWTDTDNHHYEVGTVLTVDRVAQELGAWYVYLTLGKCSNPAHKKLGSCGGFYPCRVKPYKEDANGKQAY